MFLMWCAEVHSPPNLALRPTSKSNLASIATLRANITNPQLEVAVVAWRIPLTTTLPPLYAGI